MGNNNQTDDFQQKIQNLLSCLQETGLEYGSVSDDNIFQILNIENKELFHSRFLKYLIDNNWDNFIKFFKLNENKNAGKLRSSQCEFFCPAPSDCQSKNGRIDLYFEAEKYIVAIEVKWRAGEQPTQLLRYHRYLQKSNKQFTLIFLTPTGRSANKTACYECEKKCSLDNTEYYNLSFAELTNWLEDLEESNKNGLISQYREILTKETKNIMNAEKLLKMMKKMNKADTFEAACELANDMDTVRNEIRDEFFKALKKKLNSLVNSLGYNMSKSEPKTYEINYGNNNEKDCLVAYTTNLYCQKGDKWWYIKPEWFKHELNLDPNQQSDTVNAKENCKINLTKLSGADNPVVKWYFEEDTNKEKMIDNVAKNILRQLGLNNTH